MSKFPGVLYKFSSFQARIGLETINDVDINDSKRIENVEFINKTQRASTCLMIKVRGMFIVNIYLFLINMIIKNP